MSTEWKPISELPEKPEGRVLIATARSVLGIFSGRKQIEGEDVDVWFIDNALYDGEADPEFFLVLPPIPFKER